MYPINILHVNPNSTALKVIDLDEVGSSPVKDMWKFMGYGSYSGCYVPPEIIAG